MADTADIPACFDPRCPMDDPHPAHDGFTPRHVAEAARRKAARANAHHLLRDLTPNRLHSAIIGLDNKTLLKVVAALEAALEAQKRTGR